MPNRSGSPRAVAWLGISLALAAVMPRASAAQGAPASAEESDGGRLIFYKSRGFRIPVTIPAEGRELVTEVRLWVSDDLGYNWKPFGRTTPDRPEFPFRATRDAEYWFALQTVDRAGKIYPADDRPVEPSLRVLVDTAPPTIELESQGRKGAWAAVRWEAKDEYLVGRSFALEYQVQGAEENDWRSVPLRENDYQLEGTRADYRLVGMKSWDAGTADPIRVRASVKDRANNARTVEVALRDGLAPAPKPAAPDGRNFDGPASTSPISSRRPRPGSPDAVASPFDALDPGPIEPSNEVDDPYGGGPPADGLVDNGFVEVPQSPSPAPSEPTTSASPSAAPSGTLTAGSSRFSLKYKVEDAGPAGVALVQLWLSHDNGRTWYPLPEDDDKQSPYDVDVGGEGTFGLWLVVQGVSGLGDQPPRSGDRPKAWVEVDSSPPQVEIDPPRIGTNASAGKLLVTWRASDPHLTGRPVSLSYRPEGSTESWTPIAAGIENSGRYIWTLPQLAAARIRIRIEVVDTLGHLGASETDPVLIDLARPTGRIIGLDPADIATR